MQKEKKIVILSQASTVFCHNFRKKDIIHDPIPSSKVNPIRNKPKGSPPSKEENEGSVALCSDAFFFLKVLAALICTLRLFSLPLAGLTFSLELL